MKRRKIVLYTIQHKIPNLKRNFSENVNKIIVIKKNFKKKDVCYVTITT